MRENDLPGWSQGTRAGGQSVPKQNPHVRQRTVLYMALSRPRAVVEAKEKYSVWYGLLRTWMEQALLYSISADGLLTLNIVRCDEFRPVLLPNDVRLSMHGKAHQSHSMAGCFILGNMAMQCIWLKHCMH